jgi:hypothetical protein
MVSVVAKTDRFLIIEVELQAGYIFGPILNSTCVHSALSHLLFLCGDVPVEGICPFSREKLRYLFNILVTTARQALWEAS